MVSRKTKFRLGSKQESYSIVRERKSLFRQRTLKEVGLVGLAKM